MKQKYKTGTGRILALGALIVTQATGGLYADTKFQDQEKGKIPRQEAVPRQQKVEPARGVRPLAQRPAVKPAEVKPEQAQRPGEAKPALKEVVDPAFLKETKLKYEKLAKEDAHFGHDNTFEDFFKIEKELKLQRLNIQKGILRPYRPGRSESVCGNGSFEEGRINPSEWTGGYGRIANPYLLGLRPGPLNSANSNHTVVPNAQEHAITDPYSGISVKHGGKYALRLGNAVNGFGNELISKTFKVDEANRVINFWYAVVMQDPGHSVAKQPAFEVRVLDDQNNIVPNAADLGGGVSQVISNRNNPFFQSKGNVLYKDWDCASLNLSSQLNKFVTVQFINRDCGHGGHWGYTYLDDFCGKCEDPPSGSANLVQKETFCPTTGDGQITVAYRVPRAGSQTGTAQLTFSLYQDGNPVSSFQFPPATSDGEQKYTLKPCGQMKGVDPTKGYDIIVTSKFEINGQPLTTRYVGQAPDGLVAGLNNDCPCKQPEVIDPCCPDFKKLTSMWNHLGGGTYQISMDTQNTQTIVNQIQAYVDYLKTLDPSVTKIVLTWNLVEGQASPNFTPSGNAGPSPIVRTIAVGGNGLVGGAYPVFNNLSMGRSYRVVLTVALVKTGTSQSSVSLPKDCPKIAYSQYYWMQSKSSRAGSGLLIDGKPAPTPRARR